MHRLVKSAFSIQSFLFVFTLLDILRKYETICTLIIDLCKLSIGKYWCRVRHFLTVTFTTYELEKNKRTKTIMAIYGKNFQSTEEVSCLTTIYPGALTFRLIHPAFPFMCIYRKQSARNSTLFDKYI